MRWSIDPTGLEEVLLRLHQERTASLRDHLRDVRRAVDAGVDLRRYFLCSLMDSSARALDYSKRFGTVRAEHDAQERILKDSALWYREVFPSNCPTA